MTIRSMVLLYRSSIRIPKTSMHKGLITNLKKHQAMQPKLLDDGVIYMYDIALHTRDYYENEAALR